MDFIPPREQEFVVDLELGGIVSIDESVKGENGVSSSGNASNSIEVSPENVKFLIGKKVEGEEAADLLGKKIGKEKNKKKSAKKAPKPPRPPKGLSLDAADQKLIKEITELAMMKRARIERMKALKKMKAAKASSSSNGNLFAMLFTILFCLVILFQGMSSRSSAVGFQGSPKSAEAAEGGLILVHDQWNPSARDINLPGSGSHSLVEHVSGLDAEGKVNRATG